MYQKAISFILLHHYAKACVQEWCDPVGMNGEYTYQLIDASTPGYQTGNSLELINYTKTRQVDGKPLREFH